MDAQDDILTAGLLGVHEAVTVIWKRTHDNRDQRLSYAKYSQIALFGELKCVEIIGIIRTQLEQVNCGALTMVANSPRIRL